MYIVMHCAGMPFNGATINERSLGGSETAAYYVAKELVALGHRVTLFTNHPDEGEWDGVKYSFAGEPDPAYPLGMRFHFYAQTTPHDIAIVQRHPLAFAKPLAAKVAFWWLHDIALGRNKGPVVDNLWPCTGVLTVSEHHAKQVAEVYGLPPGALLPIVNGVDPALYSAHSPAQGGAACPTSADLGAAATALQDRAESGRIQLVYSSRPERGLENLVMPGGIMDRLDPNKFLLHVCGYDNTVPQMRPLYEALWARCDALPHVINHGALTKQHLARLQQAVDLYAYPTEFEEVSCITAMEAMHAGTPFVSSRHGALPETCKDSGSILLPLDTNGKIKIDKFVATLQRLGNSSTEREMLGRKQLQSAKNKTWRRAAEMILGHADAVMERACTPAAMARHGMRHSDTVLLERINDVNGITSATQAEFEQCYLHTNIGTADHYEEYFNAHTNELARTDVTRSSRFVGVHKVLSVLSAGATCLDFGCGHGHFTVALAKAFPHVNFVGVDASDKNIAFAQQWARDENVSNVRFVQGAEDYVHREPLDAVALNELLEHVFVPADVIKAFANQLKEGGLFVATTPFGPWESASYRRRWPWREHLHHMERADIHDLVGHLPQFNIMSAPATYSDAGEPLGSYVWSFRRGPDPVETGALNIARKLTVQCPLQTISLCMIVKDAELSIERSLESIAPHVDEVVLGVDANSTDRTLERAKQVLSKYPDLAVQYVHDVGPAATTGFSAARNETIERASGDWIVWMDADEVMVGANQLRAYARANVWNAYAIRQHHYSENPAAVLKTDLPCRMFRNHIGIKFYGMVHEHPEVQLNKGIDGVMLLGNVHICHHGYHDEAVRRGRFHRNIGLLEQDMKQPRTLTKMLWLRDLAQKCQYEHEAGQVDSNVFRQRAEEGVELWRELVELGEARMAVDSLEYYSALAQILGPTIEVALSMAVTRDQPAKLDAARPIGGRFASSADAKALMNLLLLEASKPLESRYY